ncbi:uncharacterized protein ARMOST_18825 [Armillaria ostoyae]|uniref:Uncharacterized protein n=1 Tax=Armillaria ostoyae TaxID=47428 RepID=A0A284S2T9_ARMOS|nr:uncharacterized protein ARMOST_18825 [Armillaria ostoyae]
MGLFSDDSDQAQAHDQVINTPHKAELSHELIAGAASYKAAKAYEKHCRRFSVGWSSFPPTSLLPLAVTEHINGQPLSHEKAKELLASFSGAFVDRTVETKGLNYIDSVKAKHHAKQQANAALADSGDY